MKGFVGREQELTSYRTMLEQSHIAAVIVGMVGVGKTALAAKSPRERCQNLVNCFGIASIRGESIQVIVWKLAGFLANNGEDGLWQLLGSRRR